MFCAKCGTKNNDDDLYCYKCGSVLAKAERANSQPSGASSGETAEDGAVQLNQDNGSTMPSTGTKKSKKGLVFGIASAFILIIAVVLVAKWILPGNLPADSSSIAAANSTPDEETTQSPQDMEAMASPNGTVIAGSLSSGIYEEDFATPEEAIEHFIKSIAANDFKGAMAVSAVNEAAVNYNAAALAERLEAVITNMGTPSEYEFYQVLNRGYFLVMITSQMKNLVYSFMDSEAAQAISHGENYTLQDDENEAAKFVAEVNPEILEGLRIIRIDLPCRESFNSEEHQSRRQDTVNTYGADECTDRIALCELDGKTYYCGFSLLRYGDSWKILGLSSVEAGPNAYGTAERITEDDYLAMLN